MGVRSRYPTGLCRRQRKRAPRTNDERWPETSPCGHPLRFATNIRTDSTPRNFLDAMWSAATGAQKHSAETCLGGAPDLRTTAQQRHRFSAEPSLSFHSKEQIPTLNAKVCM